MKHDWTDLSPFSELLGLRVDRAEPDYARLRCAWQPSFTNMSGVAHGGVVASVMDTACGVALTADENGKRQGRVVTVSFSLNYLAPFREGEEIVCEAWVVGGGRKLKTVRVQVTDANEVTVIATGHGVFRHITWP